MAKKIKFSRVIFRWIKYTVIFFFISTLFSVVTLKWINPIITPLMVIRLTEQAFSGEKLKLSKDWEYLKNISPNMTTAVVASEDQNFLNHRGFDLKAIEKARKNNAKGKRIRGASTISQQTAKNVFLWPQRSWIRKGLEVYFTFMIETIWGKKRIMTVYLNVIETGNGIYGVEAAANKYFHKSAKQLTQKQAASIAVCLPNPRKYNPAKPSPYIKRRIRWAMRQMQHFYPIDFNTKK